MNPLKENLNEFESLNKKITNQAIGNNKKEVKDIWIIIYILI